MASHGAAVTAPAATWPACHASTWCLVPHLSCYSLRRRLRARKSSPVAMQGAVAVAHVEMQRMRGVWVSTEHQCAVWCNQVAAVLGSAVAQTTAHLLELAGRARKAGAAGAVVAFEVMAGLKELRRVVSDLREEWTGLPGERAAPGGNATGDAALHGWWEHVEVSELVGAVQCFKVPQAASQCVAMCCQHDYFQIGWRPLFFFHTCCADGLACCAFHISTTLWMGARACASADAVCLRGRCGAP